ncbi:Peptidoglycan-binding lysin domain protein [Solidesulfovibrio fructosivorans JJ]]|uniref:Peptidoglycan-binding lysin domain protein n=1 Tax=Solidesulfovibrio fructosivorans JJ] TaxID=596151 RepID=E1K254_SOLFR|nr:LysM domain-containing protein [Solidesulfovibrio fructosivorans]EFL49307.1 Peptidoglycan-binding lysin domain protein [Solidesulfovibrio fructosivorans JJ]]
MSMRFPVRILFCLLVGIAISCPALAADQAKKPSDFRGITWGSAPSALPGLKAVERDGDIVHYELPSEKKDLGGITLRRVTYSFFKDRFYHAEIDYKGKDAAKIMEQSLEAKYGLPDAVREKKDADGRPYSVAVWNWPGFAFIGNRYDKDGGHGRVFYFYAPLTDASAKAQGISPAKEPAAAAPAKASKASKAQATDDAGAATGEYETYTIKDGDIISKVANARGLSTRQLLRANPDIDPKKLRPGMTIRIPVKK